jgi:hypothetical protein
MADLTFPVARVVEGHREKILQSVGGKAALTALQDDRVMRQVADVCYALLPGVIRLAVKETDFRDFVLLHRSTIVARLLV